jgi:hypothetical protein
MVGAGICPACDGDYPDSVPSIPTRHLRLIVDQKPDLYRSLAEAQWAAELHDAPTWTEIALYSVAVLALVLFCMASDAGMIP